LIFRIDEKKWGLGLIKVKVQTPCPVIGAYFFWVTRVPEEPPKKIKISVICFWEARRMRLFHKSFGFFPMQSR